MLSKSNIRFDKISGNVSITLSGAGQYVCENWTKSIPYNNRATIQATFREVFEP